MMFIVDEPYLVQAGPDNADLEWDNIGEFNNLQGAIDFTKTRKDSSICRVYDSQRGKIVWENDKEAPMRETGTSDPKTGHSKDATE